MVYVQVVFAVMQMPPQQLRGEALRADLD